MTAPLIVLGHELRLTYSDVHLDGTVTSRAWRSQASGMEITVSENSYREPRDRWCAHVHVSDGCMIYAHAYGPTLDDAARDLVEALTRGHGRVAALLTGVAP